MLDAISEATLLRPKSERIGVAQALESPEFVEAWNAHQNKSSGVPYSVEGGFDVVDKFKADQKEGFRQAAPIIHDLVMDVVRSTGGEIPYAMYVISEDGYMEYIGGRVQDVVNDTKATAQFAREHPLQAGGMAVIAVAAGGRVIGAKGTRKRTGLFKKPNPSKGKASINAVPTNNPAIHNGGKVATGQPAAPSPNKGKDSKNSKPQLQTAGVSDSKSASGSSSSNNPSSSNSNSSGSSQSNGSSSNPNPSKPPSNSKPRWKFNTGKEKNYVHFNATHGDSKPKPKDVGPNGGRLQSHHCLQDEWAEHNIPNYKYKKAPTITIETGVGFSHSKITKAQGARRDARKAAGKGPWSSSLEEELQYTVDDLNNAGFTKETIIKVLEQQYKYIESMGVPFTRIKLD